MFCFVFIGACAVHLLLVTGSCLKDSYIVYLGSGFFLHPRILSASSRGSLGSILNIVFPSGPSKPDK